MLCANSYFELNLIEEIPALTRRFEIIAANWQIQWAKQLLEEYGRYRIVYEDETTLDAWIFEAEFWDKFCDKRRLP